MAEGVTCVCLYMHNFLPIAMVTSVILEKRQHLEHDEEISEHEVFCRYWIGQCRK